MFVWGRRAAVAYVTRVNRGLRLLPLPRRATAPGGARARAGLRGPLLALRDGSARRARVHGAAQPRAARPRGWARCRRGAAAGLESAGGYGGDFATVLSSLRRAEPCRRRGLDRRHRGDPADASRAGPRRPSAVRLRGDRPARAAGAAPIGAYGASLRARARFGVRDRRLQPSTRWTSIDGWLRERGVEAPVEFVPFGVDVEAFRPTRQLRRRRCRLGRSGSPPRLLAAARRRPANARHKLPRRDDSRARSRARRPSAEQRVGRDRPAVRRDAPPARARPRRRASCARQQLLGRDDVLLQAMALAKPVVVTRTSAIATGYALEDGRERAARRTRGRCLVRPRVGGGGRDHELARALGSRARATVERELSWEQYVGRIEALLRASVGPGAR